MVLNQHVSVTLVTVIGVSYNKHKRNIYVYIKNYTFIFSSKYSKIGSVFFVL